MCGVTGLGKQNNVVIPTIELPLDVIQIGTEISGNESTQPPDPAIWQQMLQQVNHAVETSDSLRRDADAGRFDGTSPILHAGTVTRLPYNAQPTVQMTGTEEEPVLHFGIPEGKSYEYSREFSELADRVYTSSRETVSAADRAEDAQRPKAGRERAGENA